MNRFLIIGALASSSLSLSGNEAQPVIAHRRLDPDAVTVIPTAPGITTTVRFPGPVVSMDGVGVSPDPNAEGALFNLSHTTGSDTFSITPLNLESRTNINVSVDGKVYVLLFLTDPDRALFKIVLEDPPPPVATPANRLASRNPEIRETLTVAPARLIGLIDKCKAYPVMLESDPDSVKDLRRSGGPHPVSDSGDYTITPLEVYRKGEWDALVFKVAITNETDGELFFDPESFIVRAGDEAYTQAIADAGGRITPDSSALAWFVVVGDQAGGSNNLDPDNPWQVTVQLLKEGPGVLPPIRRNPIVEPSK